MGNRKGEPKVKLVSYTKRGEKVVAIACKMSISRKGWEHHAKKVTTKEMAEWIREAIIHGYWSPLEHSVYTFSIEGISRVTSHQIVRHRIASFTQMSYRFARPIDEYYKPVMPSSIEKRDKKKGKMAMKYAYKKYYDLLNEGVPEEDARYVLPNAVNTNMVVTMNARELYNFFSLRLCSRAQWEIREVAWKMLKEVRNVHPILFAYAGPSCLIHENFVREKPITLEEMKAGVELVSQRCIEGVPRAGISKCISPPTWWNEER